MVVQQIMFKYRLYPSSKQKVRIINNLKICKSVHNDLLAISQDVYKFGKASLTKFDYDAITKGYSLKVHSQVLQNVSDRVHKAFQNFFRRVKNPSCKKKGFPRYKSRVNSITFPQSGFKILSDKRLRLSKIGSVPIVLHRVPKGKIKTLTIKINKVGQWYAIFACEINIPTIKHRFPDSKMGIDVGLENLATLSNGEVISNPQYLIKSEARLKFLQRRVSRKVKGSNNRGKAIHRLAVQHLKVSNQRSDFLHKISRSLAFKYGTIAVESLNINGMLKNHWLAKSISDASWNMFFNMLSYKAVICGGQVLKNPRTRGSSHRCSKCGFHVKNMPLSKRMFKCPNCLNVMHRDHNSALNHIKDTVRLDEPEPLNACGDKTSTTEQAVASIVVETGTRR